MNEIISKIKSIIKSIGAIGFGGAISYAAHAALVFLAAVALHFGYHVSVPVLPTALGSMTGLGALRWIVRELSRVYHLGRLEAQAEKDVENYLQDIFGPLISHIGEAVTDIEHGDNPLKAEPAAQKAVMTGGHL